MGRWVRDLFHMLPFCLDTLLWLLRLVQYLRTCALAAEETTELLEQTMLLTSRREDHITLAQLSAVCTRSSFIGSSLSDNETRLQAAITDTVTRLVTASGTKLINPHQATTWSCHRSQNLHLP